MTFFPAHAKRPVDKALFLAAEAAKNQECKAFIAKAVDTLLANESPGPYTSIQIRLVVLGVTGDGAPMEVLFLHNNYQLVVDQLKMGLVDFSEDPDECRKARITVDPKKSVQVKIPSSAKPAPVKKVRRTPRKKKAPKSER